MSDREPSSAGAAQHIRDDNEALATLARRREALHAAIEHISSAVGVLDTIPEARDLVRIPEKARKDLQKVLTPLDKKVYEQIQEAELRRSRLR